MEGKIHFAQPCEVFFEDPNSCTKGFDCEFKHIDEVEEVACVEILTKGQCENGSTCKFLHTFDFWQIPECIKFEEGYVCG